MQRARNIIRPSPTQKAVMQGLPAPSCAVVGESELQRIVDIVDQKAANDIKAQNDRRDELRAISEKRVANWPNTIEAQRLRKERARKERLEDEERRRQLIDAEEAALAEAKKAHAIKKANILLYEENDRIKTFTSKLFLTTVLEEREKQLAIKEERKRREKEDEQHWAVVEAEQLRAAEREEVLKLQKLKERSHDLKAAQLQQLDDIRTIKIKERDDGRDEGRRILEAARAAEREEQEKEHKRREEQKANARQLIAANEEFKAVRERRRLEEKAEEERIAAFAAQKEQQMLERKKRVDEKFAAKLKRRQDLINHQAHMLEELQASIEEREMRALRDFDRERREREEREQEARDRRQQEIDDFQKEQTLRRRHQLAKEQEEKARMQGIWRDRAELLIEEELQERQEARERAERLQRFQLLQAQEKRMQQFHEKRGDIEEGIQLQEAVREEQEMYQAYVNSVMDEYVRKGRGADIVKAAAKRTKVKTPQ